VPAIPAFSHRRQITRPQTQQSSKMKATFQEIDTNHDGVISPEEFAAWAAKIKVGRKASRSNKTRASKKSTNDGKPKKNECPPKALFLRLAKNRTMRITAKPKDFRGASFGWSKAGGRSKHALCAELGGSVLCSGPTLNANIHGAKDGKCGFKVADFLAAAEPLEFEVEVHPFEFSTGSLGWEGHQKRTVEVGGKTLNLQVNLNCPILGSKDANTTWVPPPNSLKIDFNTIGRATRAEKDDLKKVKGIGPFIEERLNEIEIFTFEQIAAMTPKIENDVNEAIMYFPGRVHRDEWAAQAAVLAKKKSRKRKAK